MSVPFAAGPVPTRLPTHRTSLTKRRRKLSATEAANLHLASARTGVPLNLVAESPALRLLMVEDLCWQLAVADLIARRPAFWRRAERAAWRTERVRWEAERVRLAAMALEAIIGL